MPRQAHDSHSRAHALTTWRRSKKQLSPQACARGMTAGNNKPTKIQWVERGGMKLLLRKPFTHEELFFSLVWPLICLGAFAK